MNMEFTALQIAQVLGGEVVGDENVKVNNLCKIEEGKPGEMGFLSNSKYENYIYSTKASIIIVNKDFSPQGEISPTLIKVENAYQSFAKILEFYNQYRFNKTGISPQAFVSENSKIGDEVYIGEFAVINQNAVIGDNSKIHPQVYIGENVKIGSNTIIYPGVRIYHDSIIGDNCIIHSNVVIGADGFGFAPKEDGSFDKIPQIGNVIIEDNVEIGANVCIDRATMGSTIIKKGAKIDNLCQIAHNVVIGESTVMAAQTGVAGSTKIGKYCFIGGQVGFAGHLNIGNMVKIGAQSGIMTNLKDGETVLGSPAINAKTFMKSFAVFKKLPEIYSKLKD